MSHDYIVTDLLATDYYHWRHVYQPLAVVLHQSGELSTLGSN